MRAGYYVIGYTPEQCAEWQAHEKKCRRTGDAVGKRKKPGKISGLFETKTGADEYAALTRKWGGEVTAIEPTLKG